MSQKSIIFNDAGLDQVVLTDDDIISGYYSDELDSDGNTIKRLLFRGPGTDDLPTFIINATLASYVESTFSGTDNLWGSWDTQIRYNGPGLDEIWNTSDDEIEWATHEFDDGTNYYTKESVYNHPGPDGLRFTDDDVIIGYSKATNINYHK